MSEGERGTAPPPGPPPAEAPVPVPMRARRRRGIRFLLLVVVPLLALLAGIGIYLHGGRFVSTDNAYVKADKVLIGTEVAGRIAEVLVRENEMVEPGQPLLRLDPAPFRIALARAEAQLAQVSTELRVLKASYREKQASLAMARTRQDFALREQRRRADLHDRNFVSAASFDDARLALDLARQQVAVDEQDLARIAEALGGGPEVAVEDHPNYVAALAERDRARLDLDRVELRAPVAGIVAHVPVAGQHAAPGLAALALVASERHWVEANLTETDLTHVRPGQPVEVRIDTFPGRRLRGAVEAISPATGAEFALIPPQNATGNWVKIAQRVAVRIRLDDAADMPALRSGLSTWIEIDTGHRRRLFGYAWPDGR
ncbi:MAG: HlyD family secretion protein [Burkholderiaceae bacterium]|nr:HlyD family secretion protein [Burkholderiaceae bacterium]